MTHEIRNSKLFGLPTSKTNSQSGLLSAFAKVSDKWYITPYSPGNERERKGATPSSNAGPMAQILRFWKRSDVATVAEMLHSDLPKPFEIAGCGQ